MCPLFPFHNILNIKLFLSLDTISLSRYNTFKYKRLNKYFSRDALKKDLD